MSIGSKSGQRLYKVEGNKISGEYASGELTKKGEIVWTDGHTSRLWHPCKSFAKCALNHADMDGMEGLSWRSFDASRVTVERFKIQSKFNNQLCFVRSEPDEGTNCYNVRNNKLTHTSKPWITAVILENGNFQWSHGFFSRLNWSPCQECKVSLDAWVGQEGFLYRTDDPDRAQIDNFKISMKNDLYCAKSEVEDFCFENKGDGRLYEPSSDIWVHLEPNGDLAISSGYSLRMKGNICDMAAPEPQTFEEMEEAYGPAFDEMASEALYKEQQGQGWEDMDYGKEISDHMKNNPNQAMTWSGFGGMDDEEDYYIDSDKYSDYYGDEDG